MFFTKNPSQTLSGKEAMLPFLALSAQRLEAMDDFLHEAFENSKDMKLRKLVLRTSGDFWAWAHVFLVLPY